MSADTSGAYKTPPCSPSGHIVIQTNPLLHPVLHTNTPIQPSVAAMGLLTYALLAGGGVALAPAAAVCGLGLLGFSAAGPVAVAAGLQATYYGGAVGAGSLFAMAQSAAMGGIAVGTVQTTGGALGVLAAALI
ncbi:hypothetical protein M407DRAFT_139680 [Tulasnella calospora MUT 4182]|uniref:Uncharacterized protein n=1 Tax=Tulasnella calospora MUT 4182 TaxID=1051891 RepID=A0A0C3LFM0_9AGAM|nr:hypothetical protein M407DRAFT_139680 [Tulasnella calospora MUT 4182]